MKLYGAPFMHCNAIKDGKKLEKKSTTGRRFDGSIKRSRIALT